MSASIAASGNGASDPANLRAAGRAGKGSRPHLPPFLLADTPEPAVAEVPAKAGPKAEDEPLPSDPSSQPILALLPDMQPPAVPPMPAETPAGTPASTPLGPGIAVPDIVASSDAAPHPELPAPAPMPDTDLPDAIATDAAGDAPALPPTARPSTPPLPAQPPQAPVSAPSVSPPVPAPSTEALAKAPAPAATSLPAVSPPASNAVAVGLAVPRASIPRDSGGDSRSSGGESRSAPAKAAAASAQMAPFRLEFGADAPQLFTDAAVSGEVEIPSSPTASEAGPAALPEAPADVIISLSDTQALDVTIAAADAAIRDRLEASRSELDHDLTAIGAEVEAIRVELRPGSEPGSPPGAQSRGETMADPRSAAGREGDSRAGDGRAGQSPMQQRDQQQSHARQPASPPRPFVQASAHSFTQSQQVDRYA